MGRFRDVVASPSARKWGIGIAAAVGAFALFGFLALPSILKPVIEKAAGEALHRKTVIRELRVNPFALSATVRGLEISERDEPATWISAEELSANVQLTSVLRMGPVLKEIRLVKPYVRIVRRPDGSYNFSDILEEAARKPKKESKPLRYSFNNIQVTDGRIEFVDGPMGARHVVEGIQLAVPFLSNLRYHADRYVTPFFSAVVNGDAVSLRGRTRPFRDTHETVFEIDIQDLSLQKYLPYLPVRRDYEVPAALLDVKAVLSFMQKKDARPAIRLDGYAQVRNVRITGKDGGPMVFLPLARVDISPSDMGAGEYRFSSVRIKDPEIDMAIDAAGRLNLLSLVPATGPAKTEDEGSGTVFSVDQVRLSGGKIRFSDASRPEGFRTVLKDIRLDVDRLSTEEGKTADASLSLSTEAGESAGLKGTLSLSPIGSEGTVTFAKFAPSRYAPYYRDSVLFDVVRGTIDLQAGYSFSQTPEGTRYRVHGLGASINGLRLRQRGEPEGFLDVPLLTVKDGRIDPAKREISAGEISTDRGRFAIRRTADGVLNVSRLVPDSGPGGAPGEGPGGNAAPGETEKGKAEEAPWTVTLDRVSIDRYAVTFDDGTTDPPAALALEELRLRASNVTTARNGKGTFSFSTKFQREGNLSLDGTFSVSPASMAGRLTAKGLPIGPLQPYFGDKVKILVTGGRVSARGNVRFKAPGGGPVQAGYAGEASVEGFASVDKERGEDFLKFSSLHFAGIDAGSQPASLAIREIALADFYSRLIINDNGTLNVQGIFGGEEAREPSAAKDNVAASPPVSVRIDVVTLQGGDVNFSDRYVRPNYSASLVEIGGRVSGLSSTPGQLADVDLRGKLEKSAPLEIKGKINPLAEDLFLDLKVDFRDMDLSPLTPYAAKYAGYGIQKGKLTLTLSYHIEKRKLDAQNEVFLDQFTFGEAVDSPDATKLPVRLAVALLKDRQGEIHLDIPVSGQLDDPKFSVWKIVWKVVGNLLAKAATAPFALIGAMFGGGEELSYLEFEPGRSDIPAAGEVKIGNLAKALFDRPSLKLEIEGHSDPARDAEALRKIVFRKKVAAQKVKALVRSGQAAQALDNVLVGAEEYPRYLALAYREEKFPKPRNVVGMEKELPVPEMEKLMLAHIQVTEDDLRQLAVSRAARVRDALIGAGKVEPGRVFLVEARPAGEGRKEKPRDCRVEFLLK